MDIAELEKRVAELEREKRRMKITQGAVLAAVAVAVLLGAASSQELPDEIVAQAFKVVDPAGGPYLTITHSSYTRDDGESIRVPGIRTYDNSPVMIYGGLRIPVGNIEVRSTLGTSFLRAGSLAMTGEAPSAGYLTLTRSDEDYRFVAEPHVISFIDAGHSQTEDWSSLSQAYADQLREIDVSITRAVFGRVELTSPTTGVKTAYPAAMAVFDDEGRPVWVVPR